VSLPFVAGSWEAMPKRGGFKPSDAAVCLALEPTMRFFFADDDWCLASFALFLPFLLRM